MAKLSWPWAGTTVGDAVQAPYTNKYFADMFQLLFVYDRTVQGVVDTGHASYPGGLQVSAGAGFVTVQTGVGMCDGMVVAYDAPFNLTPANTPSIRTDLVVIRKTISAAPLQEVNIVLLQGTDGSAVPPALTQNLVTWEIPLAQVPLTPGPTIGAVVNVAEAIRTPLGPGYSSDVLTGDDLTHTANAWNDLVSAGDTLQVSLGPGKWAIFGQVFIEALATSAIRYVRLYNSTLTSVLATSALSLAASPTIPYSGTVCVGPIVVDLGVPSVIKLQLYARNATDTVYGGTGQPALGESLCTFMYAQRVI